MMNFRAFVVIISHDGVALIMKEDTELAIFITTQILLCV